MAAKKRKKAKAPAKKTGRPTKRTQKLDDELMEHIEAGGTVRAFAREKGIGFKTIYRWLSTDEDLSTRFARARAIGCVAIEEEMVEIANTPTAHEDDVQHRKLQLWMGEKRLVWNDRARYGQKQQIEQKVEHTMVLTDHERQIRLKKLFGATNSTKQIEVEVHEEEA